MQQENNDPQADVNALLCKMQSSPFAKNHAKQPLRVCCYGSSSSKTPVKFLNEAWSLGYLLAKRGHTCVNGAGSYGCMAAMNDGADAGDGHIIGVIHEMFVVDGNDWLERDGGAHSVFKNAAQNAAHREILIAGGKDLQERKRLLVEGADALVVLPGGPGTWDELWEMSCARNLGLTQLPIVCVSVDGFYEPFREMLAKAYDEGLVKNTPENVVHFVPTAQEAVQWIEDYCCRKEQSAKKPSSLSTQVKKRDAILRRTSFFSPPPTLLKSFSWISESFYDSGNEDSARNWKAWGVVLGSFSLGVGIGVASSLHYNKRW